MAEPLKPGADAAVRSVDDTARAERMQALGTFDPVSAASQTTVQYVQPDPPTAIPTPPRTRHELLEFLHKRFSPRTYLEIGVQTGASLALSRTRTIAIDPAYAITEPVACDLRAYKTTSDEFFATHDHLEHFGSTPVDLAFIDGMHLSEFVLRDFTNVEKHCGPGSVIILDDVLPRNDLEAYRVRRTSGWTGDVFRVYSILLDYRPDLILIPLNTAPTGTLLITNLDPTNQVLERNLDTITKSLVVPDPVVVPDEMKQRTIACDPLAVETLQRWAEWVTLRNSDAPASAYESVFSELRAIRDGAKATFAVTDLLDRVAEAQVKVQSIEAQRAKLEAEYDGLAARYAEVSMVLENLQAKHALTEEKLTAALKKASALRDSWTWRVGSTATAPARWVAARTRRRHRRGK